jgi:N6-adenosine-specific RNA methylase IME4
MKFDLIVSDPPWAFKDKLEMSKVKRGAAANYKVLNNAAIKKLKVVDLAEKNSVLALWVPSSLILTGVEVMNEWGFRQTQTWMWIKTKKDPFEKLRKEIRKKSYKDPSSKKKTIALSDVDKAIDAFDSNTMFGFGMGRLFRQCHEMLLIGVRGKPYKNLKNKSQRSVGLDMNLKHSAKPETLQNRLELMFPNAKKLEMFARRERPNWTCVGLECPSSLGEDIHDSIERLISLP